ncbi:MAG: hypothetical protein ABIO81_08400, partial [Ginsengibacter sp.]
MLMKRMLTLVSRPLSFVRRTPLEEKGVGGEVFFLMCRIALLCSFIFLFSPSPVVAQNVIPLYDGLIPGSIPGPDEETGNVDAVSKVSEPTLTVFFSAQEKPGRTAIIICPGGGYGSLVLER